LWNFEFRALQDLLDSKETRDSRDLQEWKVFQGPKEIEVM